ncbi:MAG: hypothetical protein LC808_21315, partial [Actinobacteria bacterium]|nr:hypothetical protein [Actinomycetota bacterium]
YMSYEQFGVNFVRHAVTPERIKASITDLAGDKIETVPSPVGPGGMATAKSVGHIGTVRVTAAPGDLVAFDAVLPIELDLEVRVGPVPNRYRGLIEVPLKLTVHTAQPLMLVIEIAPVVPKDVLVDLRSTSMGADVLQRMGNIDAEVQGQVARMVNEKMNTDEAKAARIIDVDALLAETAP